MNSKLQVSIVPIINAIDPVLENSVTDDTADPLFNSAIWLKAWWQKWGGGFELNIIIIRDGDDTLCKMSLYIDSFTLKNIIPIRRLQFIGTNYQHITTPRTEYLAFSTMKGSESSIRLGLEALEALKWDEFVARDIVKDDSTDLAITQWAKDNNWLTRVIHSDTAYSINTTSSFEAYKKNLGSNTRLKLINRRKLLETLGDVAIENYFPDRISEFFELLNAFHEKRWGDTFSKQTLSFHQEVMKNSQSGGLEVELSVLTVNGVCGSVMFNYVLEGRVYNINSGFNESFHKKIAIGMLHFGILIESAFQNPKIHTFDFLAGHGKNSNYKSRLATDTEQLHSIQLVRSYKLRLLYNINDLFKKLKSLLK